jgi:integrase
VFYSQGDFAFAAANSTSVSAARLVLSAVRRLPSAVASNLAYSAPAFKICQLLLIAELRVLGVGQHYLVGSFSRLCRRLGFSNAGLAIPERDKLRMKIHSRQNISFSWAQAEQVSKYVRTLDTLGDARREQYATVILLAAASGLRSSELLALRADDIAFKAGTIRVDESSDRRSNGVIGPCKNAAAQRTIVLRNSEGRAGYAGTQSVSGVFPSRRANLSLAERRGASGNDHTESRAVSSFESTRSAERRVARTSKGLQSEMGTRRNQFCGNPSTNGAHVATHDNAVQRRNPVGPSMRSIFLQDWQ